MTWFEKTQSASPVRISFVFLFLVSLIIQFFYDLYISIIEANKVIKLIASFKFEMKLINTFFLHGDCLKSLQTIDILFF